MKKQLITISLLFITLNVAIAQEGINFVDLSWEQTFEMAKLDDKIIFVDAYADWCNPCKWMARNAFMDEDVASFMNKTFICIQIDMESNMGKKFDKDYNITAYPTLFFIDGDGEVVKKSVGALDAQRFLSLAMGVDNPDLVRSNQLKAKYEGGDHSEEVLSGYMEATDEEKIDPDSAMVKAYCDILHNKYLETKTIKNQEEYLSFALLNTDKVDTLIAQDYINQIKNFDLISKTPFIVFFYMVEDFQHPLSTYFSKNIAHFKNEWGDVATNKFTALATDAIVKYKNGEIEKKEVYEFFKGLTNSRKDFKEMKQYIDDELLNDD
jgi:thiol-disulfide isomerase/thioredoxin